MVGGAFDYAYLESLCIGRGLGAGARAWRTCEMHLCASRVKRVVPGNRSKDEPAVVSASAHWTELVQRPAQCHCSMPADSSICWPQTGQSAERRRRDD